MGFPERFCRWVLSCVMAPRFSLLINGQLTDWITAQCGFRQGCPLSPYLFILCSELLSTAFRQRQNLAGVPVCNGGSRLTHLLYADDILIFSGTSGAEVSSVNSLIQDYCSWTGQRVNQGKSAVLFSKLIPNWKKNRLARNLGFRKVEEIEYLGTKLAMRKLNKADFAPLIQKTRNSVMAWGNRHLSLAGRVTLINSSLIPSIMYAMVHSLIPKSVLEEVEKICRSFLWDKSNQVKGLHYAAWSKVCKPRSLGGLGFHATTKWIGPLRTRIAWTFLSQKDTLFHQCLKEKYGAQPWNYEQRRGDSTSWRILCDGSNSLMNCIRFVGASRMVEISIFLIRFGFGIVL